MISSNRSLSLGPFTVPVSWIFIGVSIVIGFLLFFFLMKNEKERRKQIDSLLANGILLFLAIWKISPLLFRFQAVKESPILLLYLPGGAYGTAAGAAGALIYLFFAFRRKKIPFLKVLPKMAVGTAAAGILILVSLFLVLQPPGKGGENVSQEGSSIGQIAYDFELDGTDGKTYRLEDFRGKTVLLNFWATWCPPCKAEIPEMVRFYNKDENRKKLEIIAVNLTTSEPNIDQIRAFMKKKEMSFPVLLDTKNIAQTLYRINSIPTTFIIDSEGVIVNKKTGAMSMNWIERQLR